MCPNIKLTVQFVHQTKSALLCAMCQKFFSNTQMACTCMQFLCQYMHTVLVVSTDGGKKKKQCVLKWYCVNIDSITLDKVLSTRERGERENWCI